MKHLERPLNGLLTLSSLLLGKRLQLDAWYQFAGLMLLYSAVLVAKHYLFRHVAKKQPHECARNMPNTPLSGTQPIVPQCR